MTTYNPSCDGAHCTSAKSEVRYYPLGGGSRLILCAACFAHENEYRACRRKDPRVDPENFPDVNWNNAKLVAFE